MKRERSTSGFTMMEMLIAVAILVILMGLGFVGVQRYQRSMKQLELDQAAKEIFITAQNHLAVAKSQGIIEKRVRNKQAGTVHAHGGNEYYYYFVEPKDSRFNSTDNVLYDMLPRFSLDDTVRLGGSYVIEYDPTTGTVLNVFYCDQSNLSTYTFTDENGSEEGGGSEDSEGESGSEDGSDSADTVDSSDDFTRLFLSPSYTGAEKSDLRYKGIGDNNAVVGWYGGEDAANLARVKLYAPEVKIINAECLEVRLSFTTKAITDSMKDPSAQPIVKLYIKGNKSGKTQLIGGKEFSLSDFSVNSTLEVTSKIPYRYNTYLLDDITQGDKHFADLWCKGDDALIPGEDISVYAEVISRSAFANIARSNTATSNSLFGSVDDATKVASIANFRHLENLDPSISGHDSSKLESVAATVANQTSDLVWVGDGSSTSRAFCDRIAADKARGVTTAADDVQIFDLNGKGTKGGTYAPVNPTEKGAETSYLTSYDGQGHSITNIAIKRNDDYGKYAGVFGSINAGSSDMTIKDLSIVNIDIKGSESGTLPEVAGGLAGMLKGVKVSGVAVYNDVEKMLDGATDDSGIGIKASDAAGGLVGYTVNGSVDSSAAAVYVNANGDNSIAGGLIGFATASATITNSYAGGHTVNGAYDTENYNVIASVSGTSKISYAGGLIGVLLGPSVSNCYATTSVSGSEAAGGLIGDGRSGTIENSYATGLVTAAGKGGTFIGKDGLITHAEADKNYYLGIVNNELPAIGDKEGNIAGITAMDRDTETYIKKVGKLTVANPYDKLLKNEFKSMYPYQTIVELNPGTREGLAATICSTHYGDWPAVETFVVNQKSSS